MVFRSSNFHITFVAVKMLLSVNLKMWFMLKFNLAGFIQTKKVFNITKQTMLGYTNEGIL